MVTYSAKLDVPRELVVFLSKLLGGERRRKGTRKGRRALTTFWQAVLVLRWFRDRTDTTTLARDHGVARATGYRYIDEGIEALAAQAPDLHEALQRAKDNGDAYVLLDGKNFSSDRLGEKITSVKGTEIDRWYSGKTREQAGNIQAVMDPKGFPLWVSDVEPGSVHDITAAEDHVLGALYWAYSQLDLPTLADGGYQGAGAGVFTPIKHPKTSKGRPLDVDNQTYNKLLRGLRALAERGFALLTGRWRTLRHFTTSPRKIGPIVQAALVLTHYEHGRLA